MKFRQEKPKFYNSLLVVYDVYAKTTSDINTK